MPEVKKVGRPPLSPEEREKRRIENNRRAAERFKKNGYAAQKKYRALHPEQQVKAHKKEREQNYQAKIRIPIECKDTLDGLVSQTGLSIARLFVSAVEEKYGVVLHRDIDKPDGV